MIRKNIETIKSYQPGKPIEEVKRALGLEEVYKLASNEIPFAPRYIRSVLLKELEHINRYPESGCFYLRKLLANKLSVEEGQIVFGNGSDEIITFALRTFVEKGDEVIVAHPTFLVYEIQAQIQEANVTRVPLNKFRYALDAMADAITAKTKIIFIANPDNPTGGYVTHQDARRFLQKIPKNIIVFFDEAYYEFAPKDFPRTNEFLNERGNIIFSRTFSKAYGLAGLRIGYGVTSATIANALNKVREPFNINRFAQVSAVAALKNKKFLKKVLSYVAQEKEYISHELKKMNIAFVESATNFMLIDFKQSTDDLYSYFLKKGIIVREMKGWGLDNFFRVTIGLHKENAKFIACFKEYVAGVKMCVKRQNRKS